MFLHLFIGTLPLYVLVALGFFCARRLRIDGGNIATLTIYIIAPVVMGYNVWVADFTLDLILFPALCFCFSAMISFASLYLAKRILKDSRAYVMAAALGTGNTGYFGLPLAMLVIPDHVGIYLAGVFGMTLFESTFGIYFTARGHFDPKTSLIKTLKMPLIYAFILGVIGSAFSIDLPQVIASTAMHFKSVYVVLGMMIVGLSLAKYPKIDVDLPFLSLAFFGRFIVWPAVATVFVVVDHFWLNSLAPPTLFALLLLSIVPLAANTVAMAEILKAHPSIVATTVMGSTVLAMIYVPLMVIAGQKFLSAIGVM